jgi:hypothetical protein
MGGAVPATAKSPEPAQVIQIDVKGAAALVTVTRVLPGSRRAGDAREDILDLSLPPDAHLLDVEVDVSGRFDSPLPSPGTRARDGYVEATRALGLTPRALSFDDEATTRIRVALKQQKPNQNTLVRYRFSTLVHVAGGRAELVFPPTPDAPTPPAKVTVHADLGQDVADIAVAGATHALGRGAAVTAVEPSVSTDRRWVVSFGLERDGAHALPTRFTALAARAQRQKSPGATPVACAVGLAPAPARALPERVLFLIDRSRSVGPGGLEAERDIAKRILLALPPSTMFDALFFDRTQQRLFPALRTATRQALTALEDEMVTGRLTNGTDLPAALKAAGELLRRESAAFGPRALLVILSDGAVGSHALLAAAPEAKSTAKGVPTPPTDLLGAVPGVELMLAALSVRPNDDPPVSPVERSVLRAIVARGRLGGVERSLHAGDLDVAVPEVLETLRTGGDAFSVRLGTRDAMETVAPAISPGDGTAAIVTLKGKSKPWVSASLTAETGAETHSVPLRLVSVEPRWLSGVGGPSASEARLFVGPAVATLVEPVIRPAGDVDPPGPSGYLERSVVRDALSLAFTPRARACYLNRTGATPADRDLAGRVRLALDFVRGEVGDARIETSTLHRPGIETCLREAAFALDVPRAYRNDERVTAVLNLVFRPRTPERPAQGTDPTTSHEIDLLVEGALKVPPGTEGARGQTAAEAAKALLERDAATD